MSKNEQVVVMATTKQQVDPATGKTKTVETTRELSLASLNRKPLADYYRIADKFVNVENFVYEATALYDAGTAINMDHTVDLFENGYSEDLVVPNTGRTIHKQGEFLTNMSTDGQFDNGTSFLLEMISVDYFPVADRMTTVTNGAIINPATNALASYSMAAHYAAISRQFKVEFIRGEKQVMVEGKVYQYPSPFTASGAVGASAGGFMQNGFSIPTWNKLSEIHVLKSADRFRFRVSPLVNGFIPQVDIAIRVLLIGKRIVTLYA